MKQDVLKIARQCRKWSEAEARSSGRFDLTLEGMCAIASRKLWRELRKAGFKAQLAMSYAHVFVLAQLEGELYVLDITATQFAASRKKVELRPFATTRAAYWKADKVFNSESGLLRRQRSDGWADYQITQRGRLSEA